MEVAHIELAQHDNSIYRIVALRFEDAAVICLQPKHGHGHQVQFTLPPEALAQLGALA